MNPPGSLLDTGALIAFLDKDDHYHHRVIQWFKDMPPPFQTCEAVISEACFLAAKMGPRFLQKIIELGQEGLYEVSFRLSENWVPLREVFQKYQDRHVSLADACLIRCAELYNEPRILTFDSDFEVYRWGRNKKFEILK